MHQFLGGLKHAFVFAAHQDETAVVAALDQLAHEFDAIHLRHIQIEQDRVRRTARTHNAIQSNVPAVTGSHLGKSEISQHPGKQLEHERLVINHQDSECGFFDHDHSFYNLTV